MKFSIVIPTYNHGHLIEKCLNSLIDQTFKEWEAIVVNNFSQDNTVDVVNGFQDSRIRLINFKNKGIIAASRNEGIKNSRADWICFLDSDDWWYPEKLEHVKKYIEDYDVIFHDLEDYDGSGKTGRKKKGKRLKSPVFKSLMLYGNVISNSSCCVRKEIINRVNGISVIPRLIAVEDFDLWLRISEISEKFKYIPESLGGYWVGGGNISSASIKQLKVERAVLARHWWKLPPSEKRKVVRRLFYIRGSIYRRCGNFKKALKMFRYSIKSHLYSVKLRSFVFFFQLKFFGK